MYYNTAEVVPFQIRPLRVETGQHRSALAIYRKSAVGQTEKSGLATSKSALPSRTDIVSPACRTLTVSTGCFPGYSYLSTLEKAVSRTSPIGCHVRPSN